MIKIGVVQIKNSIEIKENFNAIKKALSVFASTDADVILFPECALSGFSPKMKECTPDSIKDYLAEIKQWSMENKKTVILPTAFRDGKIYNTGFIFEGTKVQRFYKTALTESEQKFFSVPEHKTPKVFTVKGLL
jgi:predicted amidohydrolase